MIDLGWILLSFGLFIILLILINSSKTHRKHTTKLTIKNNFIINDGDDSDQDPYQVVALRLSPVFKRNINFDEILELFNKHNLHFTDSKIFERKNGTEDVFYVANLIEPGTFQLDQNIKGFTFFFKKKGTSDDFKKLREMFTTMKNLDEYFNAKIIDENGRVVNHSNLDQLLTNKSKDSHS
jgi:FtsZ-interacting cell division protein ZipA